MESLLIEQTIISLDTYCSRDVVQRLFSLLDSLNKSNNFEAKYYVFGGYVRDKINGTKPSDIDLFISDKNLKDCLINILELTGVISDIVNLNNYFGNNYHVSRTLLKIQNFDEIKLDLVSPRLQDEECLTYCDFTCNNLMMDQTGKIEARCPIGSSKISSNDWTLKCINDASQKRLVWMVSSSAFIDLESNEEKISFNFLMKHRLIKMLAKDYTYTGLSLTLFTLWNIPSYLNKPNNECGCCAICQDDYQDNPEMNSVVLTCGHDFHFKCIKKYNAYNNSCCPSCREPIEYKTR